MQREDVDAIVIDNNVWIYVFDLKQCQRGNRLGHAPYPMERVVPLDEAKAPPSERTKDATSQFSEWE